VRIGIVTFPGTLDDVDAARAVRLAGGEPRSLWHDDEDLHGVDAVILPGGFSYGDYLRAGAIARFAPVMREIIRRAGPPGSGTPGLPVLGICNGFQVLCESHLLPGALVRNESRHFICRDQRLRIERTTTAWTSGYADGEEIVIPLKNAEGGFVASDATLDRLEGEGQVVVRYLGGNPNGSYRDIAGVSNATGSVVGLMPHPEHATEALFGPDPAAGSGGTDGLRFFTSILEGVLSA
jgi:phosphoribosylformylglycinamidine synthase I